ncbi:SRPBCC domain-containing protein [Leptospira sp. 96542]|nr:SRPBCC domain-containing protein [Leptospira sp. 96542]
MVSIVHRIGIKSPIAEVYKAVSTAEGVSKWWTESTKSLTPSGDALKVDFYTLGGVLIGGMEFNLASQIPNQQVDWKFSAGPDEWIGTTVSFQLYEEDGMTLVKFGHNDWKETSEFMGHCSMKWAVFLWSLREYLEQGKGKPSPHDLKIDNWN